MLAAQPIEADYADLLRARVLIKSQRPNDARSISRRLLNSQTVDDEGVPLALYAARQLMDLGDAYAPVLDLIEQRFAGRTWITPVATHLLEDLLQSLVTNAPDTIDRTRVERAMTGVRATLADQARALALQRTTPSLPPNWPSTPSGEGPAWVPFDDAAWLLGTSPSLAGAPPLVLAVRSSSIIDAPDTLGLADAIEPGTLHLSAAGSAGEPLANGFPGLRVSFTDTGSASADAWAVQRRLSVFALLAVIGVTLVGGVTVWRNVRRELRLADLRAQFVASVSHELKTPLTAIRMFAETLQMERPLDPAARAEYLDTIVNESERLTRLINNVLDYGQIERGQKVYRREPVPLGPVLRRAVQTMQYPLQRLGFGLRVDVPETGPSVRIDVDAIE